MLAGLPTPLIIAHRGASAHAPENTLAAFRLAVEQGAPAVELDVKLSRDGVPVVIHDPSVQRTTGASGLVNGLTLAELKALDAGSFFGPAFHGEPIPTLEEVFAAVGGKVLINVELTNYTSPNDGLVSRVVDLVQAMNLTGHVLFSSFLPRNLSLAKRLLPQVPMGLLCLPGQAGWLSRTLISRWLDHQALHPYSSDVSRHLVERCHRHGRKLLSWTVNDPATMTRLIAAGADGIFTDDPPLAFQTLGLGDQAPGLGGQAQP